MKTNCPNCGAAVDINELKCPFCGTPYFDISYIPLRKPFVLKVNVGTEENPIIIIAKVMTMGVEQTITPTECELFYNHVNELIGVRNNIDRELTITFTGVD